MRLKLSLTKPNLNTYGCNQHYMLRTIEYHVLSEATFRCGIFWQIVRYRIRLKRHIMQNEVSELLPSADLDWPD